MKVVVVQNSWVYKYKESYYRVNISEFNKYLDLFPEIIYIAKVKNISSINSTLKKIPENVTIVEFLSAHKIDDFFLSKKNKTIMNNIVFNNKMFIIKMPSLSLGRYFIKKCLKYNKKFVVEVVGCAWASYWYYNLLGKILAPISYYLNKKYIFKSEFSIYVTQKYLQSMYPSSGYSIGCSNVELKEIAYTTKRYNVDSLKDIDLKIGTTGPVNVKFRAHTDVLKALKKLKEAGYSFTYFLIGGGDQSRLMKYIKKYNLKKNVFFMGSMDHKSVIKTLDELDLYIHPSKAEGLPRALIEAMSRAIPCIAADTSGNSELLSSKYIFKKGDCEGLLNIILDLTPRSLENMSESNLNKSREFLYCKLCTRRKDFFRNIVKINTTQ